MQSDEGVVDAEVIDEEPTKELVHQPAPPGTLFRTDDPDEIMARATKVADRLADILKKQGLTTNIRGREHVQVEGWQTTGSLLGVYPVETRTTELPRPEGAQTQGVWGFESRYEARTRDGAVVGAGVARCTRGESTWRSRDDYALESMAQTRATSKALKAPLGWIMPLAGYVSTPAEEMSDKDESPFGAAAGDELEQKVFRALVTLFEAGEDPDDAGKRAVGLMERLAHEGGGSLPRVVGRAIGLTVAEYNATKEKDGSNDSSTTSDERRSDAGDAHRFGDEPPY